MESSRRPIKVDSLDDFQTNSLKNMVSAETDDRSCSQVNTWLRIQLLCSAVFLFIYFLMFMFRF